MQKTQEQMMNDMMNIDLSNATVIECGADKCDSTNFKQTLMVFKISSLVSPNGQEMYLPKPVLACEMCGHINEEFKNVTTVAP